MAILSFCGGSLMPRLTDRVAAVEACNPQRRKWHTIVTRTRETRDQIRAARPDILPEDGILIYRLV
jgi:hypothetical protein